MSKNIVCMVCKNNGDKFVIPRDEIGIAMLEMHFQESHPDLYKEYLEWRNSKNAASK